MKNSFPSDLNYDYANATSPHLLTPGYFLGQASVLDMFEESTSDNGDGYPATMTDEGNDFFILSAGSTFMGKSLGVTWFVELLTEKNSLIALRGIHSHGEGGGLLVAQSYTAATCDNLF